MFVVPEAIVKSPVIVSPPALLNLVVKSTVSKVGSAPLLARKNLPSLLDVPCGNLLRSTA